MPEEKVMKQFGDLRLEVNKEGLFVYDDDDDGKQVCWFNRVGMKELHSWLGDQI